MVVVRLLLELELTPFVLALLALQLHKLMVIPLLVKRLVKGLLLLLLLVVVVVYLGLATQPRVIMGWWQ
jgi:hypothetical protein